MKEVAGPGEGRPGRRDGLPDTVQRFDRAFSNPAILPIFLLLLTFAARLATMGDPAVHPDEQFYAVVGQRLLAGDTLYLDIFDHKPPGLFWLYAGLIATGGGMLAVHIGAALCVFATAWFAVQIARRFANAQGAVLAGCIYILLLPTYGGAGGQSPLFYNALMAFAAWRIVARQPRLAQGMVDRDVFLAMVAAGAAITVKQSAVFEAIAFGCWTAWQIARSSPWRAASARIDLLALAGMSPMVFCFAVFAADGHLDAIWDALVTSNFRRTYPPGLSAVRMLTMMASLSLIFGLAIFPVLKRPRDVLGCPAWAFAVLWLTLAIAAVWVFPIKVDHYLLPMLVPLAIVTAPALGGRTFGLLAGFFVMAMAVASGSIFDFGRSAVSRHDTTELVEYLASETPGRRLLMFGGTSYPYLALDARPGSPLVFGDHLSSVAERDVSRWSTRDTLSAILESGPETVVMPADYRIFDWDPELVAVAEAYVAKACRVHRVMKLRSWFRPDNVIVHTRCRPETGQGSWPIEPVLRSNHPKASTAPSEMARP